MYNVAAFRFSDNRGEAKAREVAEPPVAEAYDITVRGCDIGDLPTEYDVTGLMPNELPVIGRYKAHCGGLRLNSFSHDHGNSLPIR